MRLSLVALGSRSAGPVYSFQMAQALSKVEGLELQVIISKEADNLESWDNWFSNRKNVDYHKIETYKHNIRSLILSFINPVKIGRLVRLINNFNPDAVYFPFGLMWSSIVFPIIRNRIIITTNHDPHPFHHGHTLGQYTLVTLSLLGARFVSGRIVLNSKDSKYIADKYKCPVQVVPHAAYNFYVPEGYKLSGKIHRKIAFLGRIDVYKGVSLLVRAFPKIKTEGMELIIAGSGDIDDETMRLIKANPNINLQNRYIPNEEIPDIMNKVDLVVLPYTNATQSGVIPLAFAFGKPVIATNVGALDEQVPPGIGLLVNPDADAIAGAVDRMYAEEGKIFEYSRNAKKYVEEELTWDHSADLIVSFAESILKDRKNING